MKPEVKNNIMFILYFIAVVILAIIYFTVPERKVFLENQVQWWSGFWTLLKSMI